MTSSPTTEVVTSNLPTAGTYNIDAVHSTVGFVARHLVASKVRGRFTDFSGAITIGDTPETSSVQATYPTLTLTSTKVSAKGDNYEVVADLTIKGITKSVTFDLEYLGTGPSMTPGVSVTGFEASAEFDRRDFGITFGSSLENGAMVVGNKIVIELAVEAHQAV